MSARRSVVANSLSDKQEVSEMVRKQLKQLYASAVNENGELHATLVSCVQQTNGDDCGVFAAAFLFEWATTSVNSSLNVQFDVPKMRPHPTRCLESHRVLPFPKIPSHVEANGGTYGNCICEQLCVTLRIH